jgi:hypothetical protein
MGVHDRVQEWHMNEPDSERSAPAQAPVDAKIDTVGWGVLLMWVGAALFADVGWPTFFLGAGLIVLGSQAARSYFGMRLDWFALVLGICLVATGGLHALDIHLGRIMTPAWLVPSAFIAAGVVIALSAWRRRGPRSQRTHR